MKLRKFNDFKRIYENNPGMMMEPGEPEELEMSGTQTKPDVAPPPTKTPPPKPDRIKIDPAVIPTPRKAEIDEEGFQAPSDVQSQGRMGVQSDLEEETSISNIDSMLPNLFTSLEHLKRAGEIQNVEMIGNLVVVDGVEIDFISEEMCYTINGKTMKNLKTPQQVVDYIKSGKHMAQMSAQRHTQGKHMAQMSAQSRPQAQSQGLQRAQPSTQMPGQAPSQTGGTGGQQRIPMTQPMQEKFRRKY